MVGDREKVLAAGFDGYISKPIVPETFVDQLERFLRRPCMRAALQEGSRHGHDPRRRRSRDRSRLPDHVARHRGHRVLEAGDGAEALAVLAQTPVDLVVSDILMPTMDGYELVRRMGELPATALVPVMFFTAHYNEREARSLAEACGVSRVLTKPTDPAAVFEAIDQVLGEQAVDYRAASHEFDQQHLRVVNDKLVAMTEELIRQAGRMAALIEINLQLASERDPGSYFPVSAVRRETWSLPATSLLPSIEADPSAVLR